MFIKNITYSFLLYRFPSYANRSILEKNSDYDPLSYCIEILWIPSRYCRSYKRMRFERLTDPSSHLSIIIGSRRNCYRCNQSVATHLASFIVNRIRPLIGLLDRHRGEKRRFNNTDDVSTISLSLSYLPTCARLRN